MPGHHKTTHRLSRRLYHKTAFQLTHGPRSPNYAAQAISAFGHYIKRYRRLMKLVPEVFDSGIANHLLQQKAEQEAHMQQVLPILAKVYGSGDSSSRENAPLNSESRCKNGAEMV